MLKMTICNTPEISLGRVGMATCFLRLENIDYIIGRCSCDNKELGFCFRGFVGI